ncbi:MAG: PhzF family phenazine biosynthesis protein [Chloroflexi bacterium]|nr:PhzF family phenazine biosynthesis protein [Chloroflexota bacterium]
MMRLNYHLVDVFTNRQFGGNQLAVFPDPPADLPTGIMQRIAAELNLSETTFAFPPEDSANDCRLRIFTPAAELPMAGHPTIGTAYMLARLGSVGRIKNEKTIVFEEGVGPIRVTIHADEKGDPSAVWMRQPNPQFLGAFEDCAALADMLSLAATDIRDDLPAQVVSSGLPFLFIVLDTLDAMKRIRFRSDKWAEHLAGTNAENVFVTTLETVNEDSTTHSRMFAPALGISEDPATGSASGPLGAYLLRYGLTQANDMLSEQGFEMGRPSFISIHVEASGDSFSEVSVGGQCAYIGFGTLVIN